jgi:hypothetical protein
MLCSRREDGDSRVHTWVSKSIRTYDPYFPMNHMEANQCSAGRISRRDQRYNDVIRDFILSLSSLVS